MVGLSQLMTSNIIITLDFFVLQRAEFEWDKNTQSSILSAFFYGYIITQIPGGWLADRFGGRLVLGFAMAVSGISTVLIPVSARTSIILVYVLRAVLGLASVR